MATTYNPRHTIDRNPATNEHLAEIMGSIATNGWQGLPLLVSGYDLLTGTHRATACAILDVEPEVHQLDLHCNWGDEDYSDDLLRDLCDAGDSLALLRALKALRAAGLVDQKSVDIMQAEYDKE
jgi:hypothetical protein